MGVAIEVGAHNGSDSTRLANTYGEVHAFEPAPYNLKLLERLNDPRIHIVPMAVGHYNGRATFHLDELGDGGCGSLMKFAPNREELWPGREDLVSTGSIRVRVTRLDTYMKANAIDEVDFLHVDAQGADLDVLRGLGELHTHVKAGRVEAATKRETALYRGQPLLKDICDWLDQHGFGVIATERNDQWEHEVNVDFRRAG